MRGQAWKAMISRARARITPADAGTRNIQSCCTFRQRDHPRGCGDKCLLSAAGPGAGGSPPRMRGQVSFCSQDNLVVGITPADAGTRRLPGGCHVSSEDHPRGCGDKISPASKRIWEPGSPPRMRGQDGMSKAGMDYIRITPADAGTSRLH